MRLLTSLAVLSALLAACGSRAPTGDTYAQRTSLILTLLASTLKTAWRGSPRADGPGQDLLMVLCRPDFAAADTGEVRFVLTFQRYTFDGERWRVHRRQTSGCYESDEQFPAAAEFP